MEQMLRELEDKLKIDLDQHLFEKHGTKPIVTIREFLIAILSTNTGEEAINSLGRAKQSFNRAVKKLFPGNNLQAGRGTWRLWLEKQTSYKHCRTCDNHVPRANFTEANCQPDGLDAKCKDCKKAVNSSEYAKNYRKYYYENNKDYFKNATAKRRALILQAIPAWADLDKIKEIYKTCPKGSEVDHIVPLQGKNVCGLHVENNLQHLTIQQNRSKYNKF